MKFKIWLENNEKPILLSVRDWGREVDIKISIPNSGIYKYTVKKYHKWENELIKPFDKGGNWMALNKIKKLAGENLTGPLKN